MNDDLDARTPELPREVDPEALAELEKNLAAFKAGQGATVSGAEAAGATLDDLEIDPELRHLYERGRVEDTEQGPKWVTPEKQYLIVSGTYSGEQFKRNKAGYFMRLDDMINLVINGPEGIVSRPTHGWKLGAIIPNGAGMGVAVLERAVKRVLPDPAPVQKTTPVEEIHDEELRRMNESAADWQKETQGEPDVGQHD